MCPLQQLQAESRGHRFKNDEDKENCRRVKLLQALGDANVQSCYLAKCCNRCNHGVFQSLNYKLSLNVARKHVAQTQRQLEDDADTVEQLRDTLITEQNEIISSSPGLTWLGPDHVCSDKIISIICERAHLIKPVTDPLFLAYDINFTRPYYLT